MDSDRVLVMDSGRVAEYDIPHLLLQKPQGHFTKMVEETGPSMTNNLREIARITHENRLKENDTDRRIDYYNYEFHISRTFTLNIQHN